MIDGLFLPQTTACLIIPRIFLYVLGPLIVYSRVRTLYYNQGFAPCRTLRAQADSVRALYYNQGYTGFTAPSKLKQIQNRSSRNVKFDVVINK